MLTPQMQSWTAFCIGATFEPGQRRQRFDLLEEHGFAVARHDLEIGARGEGARKGCPVFARVQLTGQRRQGELFGGDFPDEQGRRRFVQRQVGADVLHARVEADGVFRIILQVVAVEEGDIRRWIERLQLRHFFQETPHRHLGRMGHSVEVAIAPEEVDGEQLAAVSALPVEVRLQPRHAAPDEDGVDPKQPVDLWALADVPEGVHQPARLHRAAKLLHILLAVEEIADQQLAAGELPVWLAVVGTENQVAASHQRADARGIVGRQRE